MIIKRKDSKQADIDELTALLDLPLPENKRFLIKRELNFVKSGERGEEDSAYFIDFYHATSKNWAVIHDLRLEIGDKVAQIDHLLIGRLFDFYILETKNYAYGIKITDNGEFLVKNGDTYTAVESPIEQNKRHQAVLEKVIEKYDIMPKRLGITISPIFHPFILVSPTARVIRPPQNKFDTSMVIKSDELRTIMDKKLDEMSLLDTVLVGGKMSSIETVKEVAMRLAALHKPIKINYRKRFGLEEKPKSESEDLTSTNAETPVKTKKGPNKFFCFQCRKTITEKVAKFCWDNKRKFGGKAYCFDCQKEF